MFGEGGRVEDHEVVGVGGHLADVGEGVGDEFAVGNGGGAQGDVLGAEADGFLGAVDGVDGEGAAAKGVDGEAAGVAEGVQDAAAAGVVADEGAVVALVEEEAGLLAAFPVGAEGVAVLEHEAGVEGMRGGVVGAPEVAVDGVEAALGGKGAGAFVVDGVQPLGAVNGAEGVGELVADEVHADGVGLDDGGGAVDVDDEAG